MMLEDRYPPISIKCRWVPHQTLHFAKLLNDFLNSMALDSDKCHDTSKMLMFRLLEKGGVKGLMAFGAVLFSVNACVFVAVSQDVRKHEQEKSDALERERELRVGRRPPPSESMLRMLREYCTEHSVELRRLRRERGMGLDKNDLLAVNVGEC